MNFWLQFRDFTSTFKDFRDFRSDFKVFKPVFIDFWSDFTDYRDCRDFRSDLRTFFQRISELVGPLLVHFSQHCVSIMKRLGRVDFFQDFVEGAHDEQYGSTVPTLSYPGVTANHQPLTCQEWVLITPFFFTYKKPWLFTRHCKYRENWTRVNQSKWGSVWIATP